MSRRRFVDDFISIIPVLEKNNGLFNRQLYKL